MEKPKPNPATIDTYTNSQGQTVRIIPEARRKPVSIDTVGGGWARPRSGRTTVQIAHHFAERPVSLSPEPKANKKSKKKK